MPWQMLIVLTQISPLGLCLSGITSRCPIRVRCRVSKLSKNTEAKCAQRMLDNITKTFNTTYIELNSILQEFWRYSYNIHCIKKAVGCYLSFISRFERSNSRLKISFRLAFWRTASVKPTFSPRKSRFVTKSAQCISRLIWGKTEIDLWRLARHCSFWEGNRFFFWPHSKITKKRWWAKLNQASLILWVEGGY